MSFVPTATAVLNYWVRILAALEKKINRQSYETWLKPTRFSHLEGKKLFVRIPSNDFQHIGDRYADLIQEAIDNLGLEVETVTFTTPEQDPRTPKVREDGGFAPVPSHSQNARVDTKGTWKMNPVLSIQIIKTALKKEQFRKKSREVFESSAIATYSFGATATIRDQSVTEAMRYWRQG